jgi:polyhydroxyalkanoate synthase
MFDLIDGARRQAGIWFDAAGMGKQESQFRLAAKLKGACLRAYQTEGLAPGPVLLIIPAPFKRPYIWDLCPDVSVIKQCIAKGWRVYLLDWALPGRDDELGLGDYAHRLPGEAIDAIEAETGEAGVILAGNSLGGTFAAIFASLAPERVSGLALIDAPLAFGAEGGRLAHLARAIPDVHGLRASLGSPVRGSVLDLLSVSSMPEVFLWQRHLDFALSLADVNALDLHLRVLRWTLDEFPLPGQLFEDILDQLYMQDCFMRGTLMINGCTAAADNLRSPVFAVLNPFGRVVPPGSVETALRRVPGLPVQFHTYEEEVGTLLQHIGPLVSHRSHERLWPEFLDWAMLAAKRP